MKDFDALRAERAAEQAEEEAGSRDERTFQIGGETFVTVPQARPWTLLELAKIKSGGGIETIVVLNRVIVSMIDPDDDAHARWQHLLERDEDPVTLQDMQDLVQHLIEVQSARTPTRPPSPSSSGPGRTGTRSTAASSSKGARTAQPV